jgi:hypothetical protein
MLEAAHILASVAIILLVASIAAWANPLGLPSLRRLNGSAVANGGNLQLAALLLLAAVGSSTVAAILAIAGWFVA